MYGHTHAPQGLEKGISIGNKRTLFVRESWSVANIRSKHVSVLPPPERRGKPPLLLFDCSGGFLVHFATSFAKSETCSPCSVEAWVRLWCALDEKVSKFWYQCECVSAEFSSVEARVCFVILKLTVNGLERASITACMSQSLLTLMCAVSAQLSDNHNYEI